METETGATGRARFRVPPGARHVLKFALGAAALWALIRSGALDPALVGQAFVAHPWLCLCAFLSYLFVVVMPAGLRWFLLIRQAGLKADPGRVFSLQMIGLFFNSLIPGGTGGDLIKGYYLFKEHDAREQSLALTSIAMDRFIGLYSLLCVAMAMTLANHGLWKDSPSLKLNSLFYAGVFLAFTGLIAFFFSPWSARLLEHPKMHRVPGGRFLRGLSQSLLVYRSRPSGLLLPLALGILVDCGLILLYYFSALSLGMDLPLAVHGFVVPTLTMINGIPISPSGLGVGEAAGKMIYGNLGVTQGGGEVLALVHICILAMSLSGAPFYFLYRVRSGSGGPKP
ncbi:MAG TPA: lysylphosphatidylglycerol synthase transmembrane domain-containing protein [Fibrobacteria bacterium]|nr:lysylphosphatidylglycerol synthase transmembrane domain-containing protein [Fibrobacteria bacterium]